MLKVSNITIYCKITYLKFPQYQPVDNVSDNAELILGLPPANERRRYKVTPSLIGWAQT